MTHDQINEIEKLKDVKIDAPIKLEKGAEIINARLFVESHVKYVRANFGKEIAIPYWNRLIEFRNIVCKR